MDVIRLDVRDLILSDAIGTSCDAGDDLYLIQLRYVLPQILNAYSGWSSNLYLENGITVTGVIRELVPCAEHAMLLRVGADQYVPLLRVAAIRIPGAYYEGSFDYLPDPALPPRSDHICFEKAVRAALSEDELVQIRAGGQIVSHELVMESVFGMIVTACYNGIHPTFISSWHIDSFTIR